MKAFSRFSTTLALSLMFLLTCAVPVQSHAQAFGPPSVSANFAFPGNGGAFLSGSEFPSGNATVYGWFEWGTSTSYGSSSTPVLCTGSGSVGFNAQIFGLIPNTLYHWRADASNNVATGFSSDSTFTTPGPPVITNQPQSQVVAPGTTVTLTVGAYAGLPLSYQWEKNDVNIDSATNPTLTITNAQLSDGAIYTVQVSNQYFGGYVIYSTPASLNVGSAPTPMLQTTHAPGSLVFSWPVYFQPGYKLESSTNLTSTNWTSVSAAPVTNGNTITATISVSNAPRFFRLHFH